MLDRIESADCPVDVPHAKVALRCVKVFREAHTLNPESKDQAQLQLLS
jgi:hypothetical protein